MLFLASDEARYITGLTMTVDGGSTARTHDGVLTPSYGSVATPSRINSSMTAVS